MSLNQYHTKRDFSKTPEPEGKVNKGSNRLFVIQKHAASHLHYDFRIELDGVLKSWAVPKGPSLDYHVKRLAMHVEDHPVEYGSFEGVIPKGQYGGGTVMLWDKGVWESLDSNPSLAYKKGHLRFELNGVKLKGRWDLIRFKDEKHWFLIKYQDKYSRSHQEYDITEELNKSILTQQTIEDIATNYENIWSTHGLKKVVRKSKEKHVKPVRLIPSNLKQHPFPDFISPQLATLVDKVPKGADWLHEIKFDGYRILAFKKDNHVILKSRNNNDWTTTFSSVAAAVKALPEENVILDGEVVVLDKHGRSDFQLLQNSLNNPEEASFLYFIFDLPYIEQYDLRKLPLIERKSILKNLIDVKSPILKYSDHIIKDGQEMFEHSCHYALEGIVSKKANGLYVSKRSKEWLKIKCLKRQEFVIGGYTRPKGSRSHFGALLLGVYNSKGTLDYAGNVGTGFNAKTLNEIHKELCKHAASSNPFTSKPPGYSQIHWVEPALVGEVEFTAWTKDGHLRHPVFKGLRLDKQATGVMREHETALEDISPEPSNNSKIHTPYIISHPEKIVYPEDKITKQDLLTYYDSISDYILPFIQLRPLTLLRCPSSYQSCFYQRHFNKTTQKALHSVEIDTDFEKYIYLNDKEGLLSLVQMGVLEIHPWGSTIKQLDKPDIIVIDLDPAPDVLWSEVVDSAQDVRHHLAQYKLVSFVKSTGGKGLHVVIPITPEYDWDDIKEFTHTFVQFMEKLKPKKYISIMTKSKRKGKIFIDYLRNQHTATSIATYSTRARLHAPVSTPLAWDELSDHIEDNTYTIKTLPLRLCKLKEDPWKDFWNIRQSLRLDEL